MFPRLLFVWLVLIGLPGCGGPQPVTGGTECLLHSGSQKLSEIQVTVHRVEGAATQAIGFGVPDSTGSCRLVATGGAGPLTLTPGEYRCTLESVGAPVTIPPEYAQASTTPLKVNWSASDPKLDLEIPALAPIR